MVSDAEKFKKDDEAQREKISAKNSLESYCFNMKQTIEDEKLSSKLSADDKKKIEDACNEAVKWLDSNQSAEKEEYEHKLKEVEKICSPIITKMYQGADGMPAGGAQESSARTGPTIDEVD